MIYEVNSNDPKEGILMSDKNNNVMMNNDMNNNMNNDNDPKERMRKKVKKAAGIALCAVLAGGLAAGSFEGINTLTGWNSSTVEAASNKENTTFIQTKSKTLLNWLMVLLSRYQITFQMRAAHYCCCRRPG